MNNPETNSTNSPSYTNQFVQKTEQLLHQDLFLLKGWHLALIIGLIVVHIIMMAYQVSTFIPKRARMVGSPALLYQGAGGPNLNLQCSSQNDKCGNERFLGGREDGPDYVPDSGELDDFYHKSDAEKAADSAKFAAYTQAQAQAAQAAAAAQAAQSAAAAQAASVAQANQTAQAALAAAQVAQAQAQAAQAQAQAAKVAAPAVAAAAFRSRMTDNQLTSTLHGH